VRLSARAAEAIAPALAEFDAFRASWVVACDPSRGPADLAALLSEAEVLITDVRIGRAVAALSRVLEPDAPWPLPGLHRHGDAIDLDWAAFTRFVPRGTAEDGRFFRGLARATRPDGEPAWLGERAPGTEQACLRLGQVSWSEIAQGLEEMERSRGDLYARRAELLRDELVRTLQGIGRGEPVCGCLRSEPIAALHALATSPVKAGTPPARRALVKAAQAAADALRTGGARVSWLRQGPDAPATGCGPGPR
jgi:hypothetical protein